MSSRVRKTSLRTALLAALLLTSAPPTGASPSNIPDEAGSPSREAWVRLLQGDSETAARLAQEAIAANDDPARAAACLAEALHHLRRQDELTRYLREGSIAYTVARAAVLRRDGRDDAAESELKRALHRATEAADSAALLVVNEQLAVLYQGQGRYAEAVERHRGALHLAAGLGDSLVIFSSSYGLAYSLIPEGARERSARLAQAALDGARRWNLHRLVGHAEALLGTLRWFALDPDGMLLHFESALMAYEAAGDVSAQASSLRRLAATNALLGDYPVAIERLRSARGISLAAGDTAQASFCLEHLGSMNRDLGDLDLARRQWEDALREGSSVWPPEWKNAALLNIASVLTEQERYGEARTYLERAVRVLDDAESRLEVPRTMTWLARCLRRTGDLATARARLDSAAALARELDVSLAEVDADVEMGRVLLDSDEIEEAEKAFLRARELGGERGFFAQHFAVATGLADVARRQGRLEDALQHLRGMIDIAEGVRRQSREVTAVQQGLFARSGPLYEKAVDILFEMNRLAPGQRHDGEAFELAQRAKARSLLDLLAEAEVELRVRADTTYRRREQEILSRIADLTAAGEHDPAGRRPSGDADDAEEEIARWTDELRTVERELRHADPRYAGLRYPQPASLTAIRDALQDGELLLEYLLGDDASYVWAVTTHSFRQVRLPPRAVIEDQVGELLPLIRDYNLLGPDPAYFMGPAHRLSRSLLGGVARELKESSALILSAHGILHFLPFELLQPPAAGEVDNPAAGEPGGFASLPFLIKDKDVSYVPSGTALVRMRSEPSARHRRRDLLLVGNPTSEEGGAGTFFRAATGTLPPPLPHAGWEMDRLALRFAESRSLSGARATVGNLEGVLSTDAFRLIHFATHGVFNEKRPRFSGILLSADPAAGDDGFLTMGEIFSLDLDCDQVVLSACSSALGEHVSGEGLVGLTRGLFYAGARSVVASLWPVSGRATAEFMDTFYAEMSPEGTGGTRTHALSEAKRRIIISGGWTLDGGAAVDAAHPYFWAPFIMIGNGR